MCCGCNALCAAIGIIYPWSTSVDEQNLTIPSCIYLGRCGQVHIYRVSISLIPRPPPMHPGNEAEHMLTGAHQGPVITLQSGSNHSIYLEDGVFIFFFKGNMHEPSCSSTWLPPSNHHSHLTRLPPLRIVVRKSSWLSTPFVHSLAATSPLANKTATFPVYQTKWRGKIMTIQILAQLICHPSVHGHEN